MIEIITGRKGKGKTKYLLEKANQAMEETSGTICYVDKSTKHMYELNNPTCKCLQLSGFHL